LNCKNCVRLTRWSRAPAEAIGPAIHDEKEGVQRTLKTWI
jgi:hypothetical protein